MNSDDLETRVKNINDRTSRMEQILPTLATKEDLKAFATKDDLKRFAAKEDLSAFATKDDVREEGERTRRHFDVVAEQMKTEIALIASGHDATKAHVDTQLSEVKTELTAHDRRIMKLEAESMKRR